LSLKNDSGATLIPYRLAKASDGTSTRVADPTNAIPPGAEMELATAGPDAIFLDPVSQQALLLDWRLSGAPSVLAAVFQYHAPAGAEVTLLPAVRTELRRTAFPMSTLRRNVLVLLPDWSVQYSVRAVPTIVRHVAPVVVTPAPAVRVVHMPPPPPVRLYVSGPRRPLPPRVRIVW